MTPIWSVKNIECLDEHLGHQNVLLKVNYEVRKAANKKAWESCIALDVDNINADSFVARADLTEEIVVGWIKSTLNGLRDDFVQEIEDCLTDDIELTQETL